MKGYVCKVCQYVSINGSAPDKCPVCGSPKTAFSEQNAIKTPADPANLSELEKKHIPVIVILEKCGLIEGCTDVHARVGEVLHPMQKEHYINHIDFYLDREFLARIHLTAEKLNPAGALHIKATSGNLAAVELCSVHGAWIKEVNL